MNARISQQLIGFGLRTSGETVETLLNRLHKAGPTRDGRVVVGQESDKVSEVVALFRKFDVHHVPVVANNKVVGIVSSSDLLELFETEPLVDPNEITLASIMTKEPRVVIKSTPARDAIAILAHARYHSLPVVDASGEIWDILTTRDLVRYLELVFEGEAQAKAG